MDTQKLRVRLRKLDETVHDLRHLPPLKLDEYLNSKLQRAAVERLLQVAAQICLDIGASLVAEFGLTAPDELPNIFTTLGGAGLIPEELGQRMAGMTRFRNILIHDYLVIDPQIVYDRWTSGLTDFDDFGRAIMAFIDKHEAENQESSQ